MDLMRTWSADSIDESELYNILMQHFSTAKIEDNDILFSKNGQSVLRFRHSRTGRLLGIDAKGFSKEDIEEIRKKIQDSIIVDVGMHSYRTTVFFDRRQNGFFRYKDWFQLIQLPPQAPRPPFLMGPHPCILEMSFPGSFDREIQSIRADRACRQLEWMLSLLVPSFQHIDRGGGHAWVYSDIKDGEITSELRQPGYACPSLGTLAPGFSSAEGVPAMPLIDGNTLYNSPGFRPDESASLPDSITGHLDTICNLPASVKGDFFRACYWFYTARKTGSTSASVAYIALVSAVEALLPPISSSTCTTCGKPLGPGPTALFKEFMERFLPDSRTEVQAARKKLYAVRSSLAHGSALLVADEVSYISSRRSFDEGAQLRYLFVSVRMAILNWLEEQLIKEPTA